MSHKNRVHGKSRTPIHNLWWSMMARCHDENSHAYHLYGGRGINVCPRWRCFENFYADMGERPEGKTLDRIDNDGPYSPDNCRWATNEEQQRNRRGLHHITAFGRTMILTDWATASGVPMATLWARLVKLGWAPEKALTTPVRGARGKIDDTMRLLTEALGCDPELLLEEAA